jgi:hypothetical protein
MEMQQILEMLAEIKTDREELTAWLENKMNANQEKINANIKEQMDANQAEIKINQKVLAKINANQGKMEVVVRCIRSEVAEKIQRRIENVMECVDYKTQEITERIEKALVELQAVDVSLDTRTRKIEQNLEHIRADFFTNLWAKPINRETLAQQRSMEEKIESNKREFQAQLEEAKAIAQSGLRDRSPATNIRRDYILGRVPAPVRDCSGTQLLDSSGEIHLLDHTLARPDSRRATRHFDKSDL